jgi:hypothetical protein
MILINLQFNPVNGDTRDQQHIMKNETVQVSFKDVCNLRNALYKTTHEQCIV